MKKQSNYNIALVFLSSLLFILWALIFIYKTSFVSIDGERYFTLFDDAMISMRYAWNFSHGLGLVWNEGERVEGYTNLLMVLFMALPTFFLNKIDAVLYVQLSGIFFMLTIAYLAMQIANQVFSDVDSRIKQRFLFLVFISPLFYYPLSYWSLMGMETGLLTCLLLYATWLTLSSYGSKKVLLVFPCILGAAYLTRPDALLVIFILLIYRFHGLYRTSKGIRVFLFEAALFVAIGICHFMFRWFYYGETVPNTYVLKVSGIPIATRLENGLFFIEPFLLTIVFSALVILFGLREKIRKEVVLLIAMFVVSLLYTIWAGGDAWPYWRMTAPVIPLLSIMYLYSVCILLKKRGNTFLLVAFFCLHVLSLNYKFIPEMVFKKEAFTTDSNRMLVALSIALKHICHPDAVIAVTWAGVIPYFTDLRAIDILGKMDKHIASLPPKINSKGGKPYTPGHNRFDLNYSIGQLKPDATQELWLPFSGPRPKHLDYLKNGTYKAIRIDYEPGNYSILYFKKNSKKINWGRLHSPLL